MRYGLPLFVLGLVIASSYSWPLRVDAGPTHHSGQIDTNEVWLATGNTHILDDDVWTGDSVTLTIAPGCTLQSAADVELYTGYAGPGSIVAVGTADSMIAFTSNSTTPQPGDWRGIGIYDNAGDATRFSYCDFSYAGGAGGCGTFYVSGTAVGFDHCGISQSGDYGVKADRRTTFSLFADNTITTCADYPVSVWPECAGTLGSGNVLNGNSKDGILVRGGTVSHSGTWRNHGVPYVINADVAVQDAANTPVLTIAAGTKVMFRPDVELYVGYAAPGGLIADGTAGQITFTSSVMPPSPGDWYGVSFYDNSISSQCRLINCKVEYGGCSRYGDILIEDCVPTIDSCDIGYSSAYGIYLSDTQYPDPETLRARNTFHDNDSGDIRIPGVGIGGPPIAAGLVTERLPTIVNGVLELGAAASGQNAACRAELVDMTGRRVMDLRPGQNDIRHVAPGVYFIRRPETEDGRRRTAIRKVVVSR
jgi:hypothetical protein